MKGPFSFWTFFGLTIWIDLITMFIFLFVPKNKKREVFSKLFNKEVSVLIPIHKEPPESLRKTVNSLYKEDYPVNKVIVCGDGDTDEKDIAVIDELSKKYSSLVYVKSLERSKAKKINYIVKKFGNSLGDFLYVRDCKVIGEGKCLEKMVKLFKNEKIAAVTSHGYVLKPSNFLARSYHYGKDWVNELGRFRKMAQEKRSAVFVVCGASTLYRVDILKKHNMPSITKTEDTHYTWLLQILGYQIAVAHKTQVHAPDVDGNWFKGLANQIKQSYRWSTGTIQCMYIEGRNLKKNKKLLFTTIAPGFLEAFTYSIVLAILPILFLYEPIFAVGFLLGDTFFSLLGTSIFMPKRLPKTIIHYPQIFFFKYINSIIFLTSIVVVSFQRLTGKSKEWSNEWAPLNDLIEEKVVEKKPIFQRKPFVIIPQRP